MPTKNILLNKADIWKQSLFQPISASSLGLFRMLFGLVLVWQIFCGFNQRFIEQNFFQAQYHFPFRLFEILHLPYLPPVLFNLLILVLGLAAIMIFAGFYVRIACIILGLGFSYIHLSEKGIYSDYPYLIVLITILLAVSNADRWPALTTFKPKSSISPQIPFWQVFILRMQFIIVYFYAALSKFSTDWLLDAQPLKSVLATKTIFGLSLDQLWLAYLLSWSGFLIDLFVAVLLFSGCRLKLAFAFAISFNLVNLWLFNDLGALPVFMISGLALFLDPAAPARLAEKFKKSSPSPVPSFVSKNTREDTGQRQWILAFIAIYLMIQILVPLRHLLYPGHPSWTYEGNRGAWRMKINSKKTNLKIVVTDPATGQSFEVSHWKLLTPQQTWIDNIPDMLLQYVQALKKELQASGIANPIIRVEGTAKLNDRPEQTYIDPTVNLAEETYPMFSHAKWIVPLK